MNNVYKSVLFLLIILLVGCYNGYVENYIEIKRNDIKQNKNEVKFVNKIDTNEIRINGYSIVGYSNFRNHWLDWKYDCSVSGEILNSELTICVEPTFIKSLYVTYQTTKTVKYKENTNVNVYGDVRVWGNSSTTGSIEVPTEETVKVNVYDFKSIYLKKEKYIFGIVPDKFENFYITLKYVIKNSPADLQGIISTDTLLSFNEKQIMNLVEFNNFERTHHDSIVVIKIKNVQTKTIYIKFG